MFENDFLKSMIEENARTDDKECFPVKSKDDLKDLVCPWIRKSNELRNKCQTNLEYLDDTYKNVNQPDKLDSKTVKYNLQKSDNFSSRVRTSDVKPNPNASFKNLNINPSILIALNENGWEWPSPIQDATISKIIEGKNIIARSKNGTGKTGAYVIGSINNIFLKDNVQVIILVPTRELALQTAHVCISLSKYLDIQVMATTGGTSLAEDIYRLSKSISVVVGTPGRILDLLSTKMDAFCRIETIVLDEADKLLSIDFIVIVEEIFKRLPKNCQKLLFSATYPMSMKSFVENHLQNYEQCNLMKELPLKGVTQYYAYLKENQKLSCLKVLMNQLEIHQAIIFCNSAKRVELLAKFITETGRSTYYIHANLAQEARNRIFHDFRSGFVTFLICTDIMSRGTDVPTVNVVLNFDFPRFNETYLHRIGRCGRFGHLGVAINLITDKEKDRFQQFEKELGTKIYPIPRDIDKRLYVSSFQINTNFESNYNI